MARSCFPRPVPSGQASPRQIEPPLGGNAAIHAQLHLVPAGVVRAGREVADLLAAAELVGLASAGRNPSAGGGCPSPPPGPSGRRGCGSTGR
ncbi:hypothetical protein G6F63_016518 [Rhizopus arrhizus]|nr:hypothetical protein G6F63_016518 [Rhizopus arrhizus]